MTDQSDRPEDEQRPDGARPDPAAQERAGDAPPESVLTGFSWDDPSGAAPARPDDATTEQPRSGAETGSEGASGDQSTGDQGTGGATAYDPSGGAPSGSYSPGSYGSGSYSPGTDAPGTDAAGGYGSGPYGATPDAPAQYPPAAPYPPAGATNDPYSQPGGQPYGQGAPGYGAPAGYGSGAEYTSTPQPYAYGPPQLSPEAEGVRSKAILWTVLNSVAVVLGLFVLVFNIPSIVGLILGAMAIGRTRTDLDSARGLVRWSWILLVIGLVLAVIWWIVIIALFASLASGTPGLMGEF